MIIKKILIGLILFVIGCSSHISGSFSPITIPVDNLKVVIVESEYDIPQYFPGLVGEAINIGNKQYKIYVVGQKFDDKIYLDQLVLGHELQHILHWKNKQIINPDKQ